MAFDLEAIAFGIYIFDDSNRQKNPHTHTYFSMSWKVIKLKANATPSLFFRAVP